MGLADGATLFAIVLGLTAALGGFLVFKALTLVELGTPRITRMRGRE
ncbi:hypothetical protein [Herbaspirillum camelliae]|nr:hypothetical protein [Herbaspirillum camelliae]